MLDAFKSGGDFHSRTAVVSNIYHMNIHFLRLNINENIFLIYHIFIFQGMYKYIRDEIDKGEVLLEWDYSKGAPTKPLVKDKYASDRKKAKGMNFSIAYGKSAHGFAKDWGCSI